MLVRIASQHFANHYDYLRGQLAPHAMHVPLFRFIKLVMRKVQPHFLHPILCSLFMVYLQIKIPFVLFSAPSEDPHILNTGVS